MKLPRTLHIEGSRCAPGTSDPEAVEFNKLKGQFLVVEEKVDGSGVSIFMDTHLDLQVWHRGSPAMGKEYWQLNEWAQTHWEDLLFLLGERYVLFGEWMHDKHTIFYDQLPHFFLESDIFDKDKGIWLSTNARNELLRNHRYIQQVPVIAALKPSALGQITSLVGASKFQSSDWKQALETKCTMVGTSYSKTLSETDQSGKMEGLYIKHEDDFQVVGRYKYVRHDFLQNILNSGTHLRDRVPVSNGLIGLQQGV